MNSLNGSEMCTNIIIIDDSILEPLQFFSIVLTSNDSDVVIRNGQLMINILANDGKKRLFHIATLYLYFISCILAISIMLPPTIVVQENSRVATICVSLSRDSQAQRDVAVELSIITEGSAEGIQY